MNKCRTRSTSKPVHRGRPCGAHRGSNVTPLTTLDRQTGRAALGAPTTADANDLALPAGSRDVMRRSPLRGAEGGPEGADHLPAADGGDGAAAPILSSYLRTNCPERRRFIASSRTALLRQVERKTAAFRQRKASNARQKAVEARRALQFRRARWYDARAKGQLERFEQVRECGGKDLVLSCQECLHVTRRLTAWCRHWRLCVGCRSRRGLVYRKRFRHSRQHALHRLASMFRGRPTGGVWTEKVLTLTLPHSGDVRRDIATLPRAWRIFWKLTRLHLELDRGLSKAQIAKLVYVRVIEITAGLYASGKRER